MKAHERVEINQDIYDHVLASDLMDVFNSYNNNNINPYYLERAGRNEFAARQLNRYNVKKILNLGGGGCRHLKNSLNNDDINVYEVDLQGDCDLRVDIDSLSALPFDNCSFDVVCAFDVLEHLENFHLINEEMFRVAKDFVLISLPNSSCEIFFDVLFNRPQKERDMNRGVYSKFYGLPLVSPVDRHRWWIYFFDVIRYYYCFSLKNNAKIEFWTLKLNFKRKLFKFIFGARLYYTFFSPHIWIKITK